MGKNLKSNFAFDFSDQTAVIFGGSSGIGEATALAFAQGGANVAICARTVKRMEETRAKIIGFGIDQKKVLLIPCDVAREDDVQKAAIKVQEVFQGLDILVTCAAAPAAAKPAAEVSSQDWTNVLNIDLNGVFFACREFGTLMTQKKYGRIVNLTSFHNIATYPNRVIYNAAKSGVEGLSRALAVEWGHFGITVNNVAPGPILTPRTQWFLDQNPDNEKGMIGRTPAARIGEVKDVVSTILFLSSHEARHINGQQIVLDGGWTKCSWWGSHQE